MTRIWAVARHAVAEGVRMKVAVFFVCLVLVLVFGLPFVARGDNTASGAVQSFLTYSLAAVSLLLSLLTLFMARTVSDELVGRQILILMAKPLPRWQYVLGKWVGIVMFQTMLLAIAGGGVYGMTRYLAHRAEVRDAMDRDKLENQILVARHQASFEVPHDEFKQQAAHLFERRREEGLYADVTDLNPEKVRADLEKYVENQWRNVETLDNRAFTFSNVLCDRRPEGRIQIRYKCQTLSYPPDEIVRTLWLVGDPEKDTAVYAVARRDVNGRFHTFSVPADAVAPDGTLTVVLDNRNPYEGEPQWRNTLSFESDDGIQVLFVVGTFEGNLVRMLALVLFRLMFLAAVGVLTTAVFSYPVALLASLSVYVLASLRGFIAEAVEWVGNEGVAGVFQEVFGLVLKILWFVVPDFAHYDGAEMIVDGRNVTLRWVLQGLVVLAGVQTSILLAMACLVFQRREVSEVSI